MVPGLGARCVSDQPWVTGAETCELVLALDAIGDRGRAVELFGDIQHLRDADGAYWTGWQFVNQAHFPAERSSWTAAAMILAADALAGATGGAGLFRAAGAGGAALPPADAERLRLRPARPRLSAAGTGRNQRPGRTATSRMGARRRADTWPIRTGTGNLGRSNASMQGWRGPRHSGLMTAHGHSRDLLSPSSSPP